MDLERAKEITAACVDAVARRLIGGEDVPLPNCSLEEMLVANRMVRELSPEVVSVDGVLTTYELRMKVTEPTLAAVYALQQHGGPEELLRGLGYDVRRPKGNG